MDTGDVRAAREAAADDLARLIDARSLLEATPECLVIAARDGGIVFANRRAEELTGYAAGELTGRPVDVLIPEGIGGAARGDRFETLCRRADGIPVPVEICLGAIEGPETFLVVTLRDVTALQAGREAQFEAEAKYQSLVEQIPAVVYLDPVSEDAESIYVSPQIINLLGISQEEWLTDPYSWRRHVHPEDIDHVWEEYEAAYHAHVPLNHEYRMVHEDGTVKWVLEQAFPVKRRAGESVADPGRDLRHQRTKARRGTGRLPRVPRQAHRSAEPSAVRGDARERDRAGAPARPRRRRRLPRPRQLQARERLARPPRPGDLLLAQLGDRLRGVHPRRPTSWPGRAATSS